MKRRLFAAGVIVSISVLLKLARARLAGIENPVIAAWPSQVIFGFYFAILTFAIQALQSQFAAKRQASARQSLLLLVLIGVCLDLVLVNIQETVVHIDASYGIVAIWDTATFFLWLRTVELCRAGRRSQFYGSLIVAIAPLLKLGREILFVPYSTTTFRAYLDLLFGDALVCLWFFICVLPHTDRRGRAEVVLGNLVLIGCCYWLINALENVALLACPPLAAALERALMFVQLPEYSLSCLYFLIATCATFVISRSNVFHLANRFGTRK